MQPSYIPWIGYFDLIKRSDMFVFYDDVQYTKNDWRNRNRIKTPSGPCWLTIPVQGHGKMINEIDLPEGKWRQDHLKTLQMNYSRAAHFKEYYPFIEKLIMEDRSLGRYCGWIIDRICEKLGLYLRCFYSSRLGFSDLHKTDRLIAICKKLDANQYISPNGAKPYIEPEKFKSAGIELIWQDYEPKPYRQLWGEFVPYLSVLDLLFNEGEKSNGFI
jgi:hypothetical protein